MNPKIIFLSIGPKGYSRSWTYFSEVSLKIPDAVFIKLNPSKIFKELLAVKQLYPGKNTIVVMSPSQYLVPLVRILLKGPIILDAGWSIFEGTVISRSRYGFFGWIFFKSYIIDFFASHFSSLIILESQKQKNFYCRLFLIRKSKSHVLYTGLDERTFNSGSMDPELNFGDKLIISFRGKYNREAGLEVLAEATHLVSNSECLFVIYCPGLPSGLKFGPNVYIDTSTREIKDFVELQKASFLTLGQMAKHIRLGRTIPHKAFEAAFMGTPYLTGRNAGILEIFGEDTEISCFNPGDPVDLARKIDFLCKNPSNTRILGKRMKDHYMSNFSQSILGQEFIRIIDRNW